MKNTYTTGTETQDIKNSLYLAFVPFATDLAPNDQVVTNLLLPPSSDKAI